MTCTDCLHHDICHVIYASGKFRSGAELCKNFKNKADFVEVKHGVWILEHEVVYDDCDTYLETMYKCSICGRYEHTQEPYCHCGAKMDLEEGAET